MSDSLDDDLSSTSSHDDEEYRLVQQEWEESLQQLQQLIAVVVLPMLGKFLGRRWSYWLFERYQRFGLGKSFFWS